MESYRRKQLIKLVIAVVCAAILYVGGSWYVSSTGYIGETFEAWTAIEYFWIGITSLALLAIVLRWARVIRQSTLFWYIFLGVINLFMGIVLIIALVPHWSSGNFDGTGLISFINLLFGGYILWDFFRVRPI